jgi:hypothetical protein
MYNHVDGKSVVKKTKKQELLKRTVVLIIAGLREQENVRRKQQWRIQMFLPPCSAAISLTAICRRLYRLLLSRPLHLSPLAIVWFLSLRAEYTLSNFIRGMMS